jgi:glycosyltransferase involved in cell wall biosynthesis
MTTWYDFTTTLRNRSRNGIANVEWSLGMALLQHGDGDVRAFAFDERNGLCELDPTSDLADALYASPPHASTTLGALDPRGLRGTIRSALVNVLGTNATPVAEFVSSIRRRTRIFRTRWTNAVRRRLPPARSAPRLVDIVSPGDVVISMGADWSGELGRQLGDLKHATGCRLVTMVYDLIPLTHTHLAFHADRALFTSYYRTLVSVSDLITCISDQSRRDLLEFVNVHDLTAPPTAVLRLGDGDHAPSFEHAPRGDFFLVVGTVERRKNVELIYDALRILESTGVTVPVVVVAGAVGWGVDDFLHEIRLASNAASRAIVMLGTVDDRMLDALYRRARALLFPSHYEGWGLPLREAAVRGCPIAAGDCPAAREAVGSYAGAVLLPADDAGPWADYIAGEPPIAEPAEFHPWSASAQELRAMIELQMGDSQFGSGRRSPR